jgi:hypothetical protein
LFDRGDAVKNAMVAALRAVLAMTLAGSVFVQAVMVPLMAIDLEEADRDVAHLQIPFATTLILIVLTAQVFVVCVWRLVTMVRRETVFSHAAFRYVDTMVGAAAVASLLTFVLGMILAPGDAVAPGIVLIVGGVAVVAAGIALTVLVLRTLLAQAISSRAEAHELRSELDVVI